MLAPALALSVFLAAGLVLGLGLGARAESSGPDLRIGRGLL